MKNFTIGFLFALVISLSFGYYQQNQGFHAAIKLNNYYEDTIAFQSNMIRLETEIIQSAPDNSKTMPHYKPSHNFSQVIPDFPEDPASNYSMPSLPQ